MSAAAEAEDAAAAALYEEVRAGWARRVPGTAMPEWGELPEATRRLWRLNAADGRPATEYYPEEGRRDG